MATQNQNENLVLKLLEQIQRKMDLMGEAIQEIKSDMVRQHGKIESMNEKLTDIANKQADFENRVRALETSTVKTKDVDELYVRIRKLEEVPDKKILDRWSFFKKCAIAAVGLVVTAIIASGIWFFLNMARDLNLLTELINGAHP